MDAVLPNVKTFFKGQNIYREGQPSTVAYMIKKGSVYIYKTSGNKKIIQVRHKEGEIFGEMGVLAKAPRSSSAEAADYCELAVLTEQFIENLLSQCPKTIQHLTRLLIRRLQRADSETQGREQRSPFLSVCRLLEMAWKTHAATPAAAQRKNPHFDKGLDHIELSKIIKDVFLVSQPEIDDILDQLANLKIVDITQVKTGKAFTEKYVRVVNPETFLEVAANYHRQLRSQDLPDPELEYVDIHDLADALQTTPQILYRKVGAQEIPESLFAFHKKRTLDWAEGKGKDFFQKVSRRRKKPEDLEDVNDIVHVDSGTLKDAFAKLGYYKVGVLYSSAGAEARARIVEMLSKKMAAVVQEESSRRGPVSESESLDVQDELVDIIKASKGVPPQ